MVGRHPAPAEGSIRSTNSDDRGGREEQSADAGPRYSRPLPGRTRHQLQPGIKGLVLQLKGDRHRISFFEQVFASLILQHEQVFGVNLFYKRLFASHTDNLRKGVTIHIGPAPAPDRGTLHPRCGKLGP